MPEMFLSNLLAMGLGSLVIGMVDSGFIQLLVSELEQS